MTSIGYRAFYSCGKLTEIVIGANVKSIGDGAFQGCSNLETVYYQGTQEQWGELMKNIGANNSPLTNATILFEQSDDVLTFETPEAGEVPSVPTITIETPEVGEVPSVPTFNTKDEDVSVNTCGFKISTKGEYMIDSPHLRVTKTGVLSATSGNIGNCKLTNGKLEVPAANITGVLSAEHIEAVDVEVDSAQIKTALIDMIDAGDISFDNATGTNVDLTGVINATEGSIGNCEISSDGAITSANGNFSVSSTGDLIATDATFDGTLTLGSSANFNGGSFTHKNGSSHWFRSSGKFIEVGTSNSKNVYIGIPSGSASSGKIGTTGLSSLTISATEGELDGTWSATSFQASGSDRNLKHNIEALTDDYSIIFDNLTPVRFKYNDGTSDRFHTGFIAQDVHQAIETANLTTQDFAAYVKLNDHLALRYEEFIALCVSEIQKLKKRVAELENK